MFRTLTVLMIFATMFTSSGCLLLGVGSLARKEKVSDGNPIASRPDLDPTHSEAILAINAAYKRLCEARSYRARTVETHSSGKPKVTIFEFAAPDRHRAILHPDTKNERETIVIGKRSYSLARGKWTEQPWSYAGDDVDAFTMCTLQNSAPKLPGLLETEVKLLRQEVLDGVQVLTYRSTTDFNGTNGPDSFVVTHSIGANDGLIYRREIVTSKDETLKTETVAVFSDYNSNITIEPPI